MAFMYWHLSGASTYVRVVTVAEQLVLCAVVTAFLCFHSVSRARRFVGAVVGVSVVSIVSTAISASIIASIDSRDPVFYVMGVAGSLVLAAAFAAVVWLTGVGTRKAMKRWSAR
jgi:hypothetical protein